MASASIPTASAASQAASSAPRLPPAAAGAAGTSSSVSHLCPSHPGRPSLNLPLKHKLCFSSKVPSSSCSGVRFVTRAQQLNDLIVDNDAATPLDTKKESAASGPDPEEKDSQPPVQLSPDAVTEFMAQVSSLVKLVDSKDVVELQLKQPGCELIIRKKEALPQPPPPQVVMMQPHAQQAIAPPAYAAPPPPAPAGPPARQPASSPAPIAALPPPATSSQPQITCPMAGTFYRSPAPGQPPFVKPGDKVKKGQVLCIIEAMKLMNEIEADRAGTVVDILAEDGKPVGVGQPLFVIEP